MGRRKLRSSLPSSSESTAKKSKGSSIHSSFEQNPFRKIFGHDYNHILVGSDRDNDIQDDDNMVVDEENRQENIEADHVFDEMLQFMELSSNTKPEHHMATVDVADTKIEHEQKRRLLKKIIQNLLAYKREFYRTSSNSSNEKSDRRVTTTLNAFVSGEDITSLLLPWSVKGILQNAHKNKSSSPSPPPSSLLSPFPKALELLYWETLDECLRSEKEEDRGATSKSQTRNSSLKILTLSTMHKLVPVALRCSLKESDVSEVDTNKSAVPNVTLQEMACSCYCRLLDHLYRPPFDVVCETLLPILTSDCANTDDSRTATIWLTVAISTLRLMNLRLKDANPKKSFQLLVRPKAFLDLATIHHYAFHSKQLHGIDTTSQKEHRQSLQSIFKDLIRNGIFSSEHHMDGFRSLQLAVPSFGKIPRKQNSGNEKVATPTTSSAKSSFRGYQEGLFSILEDFLIPCDEDYDATKFSAKDATIVSCILPFFLNIFVEQVSEMPKQQVALKSHKKSKATDKLGHLQFRFFSCLSGYLIKGLTLSNGAITRTQMHDSRLRLSFLAMIGKNLDLLMRHNIYQPSLGNNTERSFLDTIGKETIRSMTAQEDESESKMSSAEWKKSLMILDVLIQLNHTILHEQLAEILARCLTYDPNNESNLDASRVCGEASSFLVTIIVSYGRLRQLDYFYLCLFDAVKELSIQNDVHRITQLLAFANDSDISIRIGSAIQGSPIQQLKQIFSNVNDTIVSRSYSDGNQFSREVTSVATSLVTKFLVGLIRNVRVDSNSFNDIYPICNDIMNGSVISLMAYDGEYTKKNTSENSGYINNAIMICSWTIYLRNRCEFWIGEKRIESYREDNFSMPPALYRVLIDAITRVRDYAPENKKKDPQLLKSLKFLACQRIQQLHGECYEKQRFAYATDAKQYSTASETSEARQLVGFILQSYELYESDVKSTSKMIDQCAVLAESIAIWAPHADQSDVDSFLNQLLQAVAISDEHCGQKGDLLISLLNDTCFYEISKVSGRLGTNIASFVRDNMQKVLSHCYNSSSQQIEIALPTSVEDAKNIHQSGMLLTCNSTDISEINKLLRGSLRVLEMIDGVGSPLWNECKDASKIFQTLMGVETICNILRISTERSFLDIKIRLISSLRITASRVLTSIPLDSDGEMFVTLENYAMILSQVLENSFKIIDHDSSSGTMNRCIHSCTMIIGSLVSKYIALGSKSTTNLIKVLDSTFDQEEVARGGFQYLILTNYAVVLLRKLGRFFGVDYNNVAMKQLSRVIKKRIWEASQEYCFNTPEDTQFLFQNQSIIFIAEALRLSSTCSESQLIPLSPIENKILVRLRSLLIRNSGELEMRSVSYLVSCLALAKPSRTVRQELINELLLVSFKRYDIFLTPLCILARGMDNIEFDEFLNKLTSSIVEVPATVIKLRIVHMIVLSSSNQSHIDIVSNHSAMIMNNCLQVMAQVARQIDVNPDSILKVSSLIVDMASKKDVMVLRERDIALILARITSTIRVEEELGEGVITDIQLKAYDASFSLVSFFLQRFSKQIHNCVPSLVISLTTMLQFALTKALPTNFMPHCGQKFSRLCELLLPHADIYKKHVICLILRFVNSLRKDVHPTCKKSLLPGIYCLLDIIQEHETMQLNSMLDEECRALLRSIYDGYKKIHVYKGQ